MVGTWGSSGLTHARPDGDGRFASPGKSVITRTPVEEPSFSAQPVRCRVLLSTEGDTITTERRPQNEVLLFTVDGYHLTPLGGFQLGSKEGYNHGKRT